MCTLLGLFCVLLRARVPPLLVNDIGKMSRAIVVAPTKFDDVYERFINHAAREVEMTTTAAAMIARKMGGAGGGGGDGSALISADRRIAAGRLESLGTTIQLTAPTAALVYMLLADRDVGILTKIIGFGLLALQMLMVLDCCRSGEGGGSSLPPPSLSGRRDDTARQFRIAAAANRPTSTTN